MIANTMRTPVHEHDCPACIFIGSYRLRHPYTDDEEGYEGYRTGVPGKVVTLGDVYLACGGSSYRYIVRYGIRGEYATTNVPAHYVLAPMVDGDDDSDSRPLLEQLQEANANAPDWRDVAIPFDIVDDGEK